MKTKLLLLFLIFVVTLGMLNAGPRKVTRSELEAFKFSQFKMTMVGDAVVYAKVGSTNQIVPSYPYRFINTSIGPNFTRNIETEDGINAVTFVPVGLTAYTLQSNGTPLEVWQDQNTPGNIHISFTYSPLPDPAPAFTGRLVKYYFSSNGGTNFSFVSNVPDLRAGFTTMTGTSDGNGLIANHTGLTSAGLARTIVFYDAYPGLGSFTALDPGTRPGGTANQAIWPMIIATQNTSLTNKFVFVASCNQPTADSTYWNTGTSLSSSTFLGYTYFPSAIAQNYAIAKSDDGTRIGIVNGGPGYTDAPDYGDVFFRESTNNGTTFSAPTKIFDAQWGSGDSLCMFNGISIIYNGNVPKVVWEHAKQTRAGNFYPGYPSQIRYWASNLPGSDPNRSVVIADTNNVGYHPYYHSGPNTTVDGYINTCRPTIGRSATNDVLFVSFMVPSDYIGNAPDTVSFMDIYYMVSSNNGTSWNTPVKLNSTLPVKDWIMPNVAPINKNTGNNYTFYLGCESDSLPGNYSTYTNNTQTNATYYLAKITMTIGVGIKNISEDIPDNFALSQNFPNPFNPTTSIRFSLPKVSDVTVKIFNVNGQLVEVLLNNERVIAGTHEVKFNGTNLASGIYFYSITTGDFKDTKKMMLIK